MEIITMKRECVLFILFTFLFFSCKEEDERMVVIDISVGKEYTQGAVMEFSDDAMEDSRRVEFSCPKGEVPVVRSVYPDETAGRWLKVNASVLPGWGAISVTAEANKTLSVRKAKIELSAMGETLIINVEQKAFGGLLIHSLPTDIGRDGGNVVVRCSSLRDIRLSIDSGFDSAEEVSWCRVKTVSHDGNDYEFNIEVDENVGVGRIARIMIGGDVSAPLIQQPGAFGDSLIVPTSTGGGDLSILLGKDLENIRRIRYLAIDGGLNSLDKDVIMTLFKKGPFTGDSDCPLSLDLSCASISSGVSNPFVEFGYKPDEPSEGGFYDDNVIPLRMFHSVSNLVECRLPNNLERIDDGAFYNCTALKKINLPKDLKNIGESAFYGCHSLTKVEIDSRWKLRRLGGSVFCSGTLIDEMYFLEIDDYALRGAKFKRLYINQAVPPVLKYSYGARIDSIFVPRGCVEAYKETAWEKFGLILEMPGL